MMPSSSAIHGPSCCVASSSPTISIGSSSMRGRLGAGGSDDADAPRLVAVVVGGAVLMRAENLLEPCGALNGSKLVEGMGELVALPELREESLLLLESELLLLLEEELLLELLPLLPLVLEESELRGDVPGTGWSLT